MYSGAQNGFSEDQRAIIKKRERSLSFPASGAERAGGSSRPVHPALPAGQTAQALGQHAPTTRTHASVKTGKALGAPGAAVERTRTAGWTPGRPRTLPRLLLCRHEVFSKGLSKRSKSNGERAAAVREPSRRTTQHPPLLPGAGGRVAPGTPGRRHPVKRRAPSGSQAGGFLVRTAGSPHHSRAPQAAARARPRGPAPARTANGRRPSQRPGRSQVSHVEKRGPAPDWRRVFLMLLPPRTRTRAPHEAPFSVGDGRPPAVLGVALVHRHSGPRPSSCRPSDGKGRGRAAGRGSAEWAEIVAQRHERSREGAAALTVANPWEASKVSLPLKK